MQREILSNQEEEIRKRDEKNSSIYGKKLEICSTKRQNNNVCIEFGQAEKLYQQQPSKGKCAKLQKLRTAKNQL